MSYQIVACTQAHLRELARTMRPEDRAEIEALGLKPRHVLFDQWRSSHEPRAALVDGEVAACWGDSAPLLAQDGSIWLFTAPPIERIKFSYFREARREAQRMLMTRRMLRAHVTCDYERSIRFFRLLGVKFGEPIMIGNTSYREGTLS